MSETKEKLNLDCVKRSFWCKIGFHKLKYTKRFAHTSRLKCVRKNCEAEFIEGCMGDLYKR